MVARKPGRFLAPVALIAAAVAVVLIVSAHTGSHHAAAHTPTTAARPPATTHQSTTQQPLFYVIKPGDSLSTISVKTKVPVAKLEALNPAINPAALQTGTKLRLRR